MDQAPAGSPRPVSPAGDTRLDYAAWLRGVPDILAELERRWDITVGPTFPLSYANQVAPATRRDGTPVVLKILWPVAEEYLGEPAMLHLCGGDGMVRLLAHDEELGAILLERLLPGTPLIDERDDEAATRIAASLMKRIWQPVPDVPAAELPFVTAESWFRGFPRHRRRFGGSGPLPPEIFALGEWLYADLLASTRGEMLVHGDLHHGNILRAEREPWLVIDPKGVIAEPAYDPPAFIYNTWDWLLQAPNPKAILERRVAIFAEELGIAPERIRDWTIARCVLSAVWTCEDGDTGWEDVIAVAELLAEGRNR